MRNIADGFVPADTATNWYALKVFYNKVFELESVLSEQTIESYIPCEEIDVVKAGKKQLIRKPLISSLMFFKTTQEGASAVQRQFMEKAMVYTKFLENGQRTPMSIPDKEMNIFMIVTSSGEKGIDVLGYDDIKYREGEHVRVIDGPFSGCEGYIKRIKGNHRFIVTVRGVCAVATSYIPRCFLEKITE